MSDLSEKSKLNRLYEAKLNLISLIWGRPDSVLWRLVELTDQKLQEAIDSGTWKLPKDIREVRKSEVLPMSIKEGDLCWDESRSVGMEWRNGEWVDVDKGYWYQRHTKGEA